MLRKGGHRPRDARAFLSVCGLTVTSQKATFLCSEKEGTARGTRGRFFQCVGSQ